MNVTAQQEALVYLLPGHSIIARIIAKLFVFSLALPYDQGFH
jgi:hypothetical protein